MRSRTEMVTTTFTDSEEDKTETEDWRLDSGRSGKRRTAKPSKRQHKRKANSSGYTGKGKAKKPNFDEFKKASNTEDEDYDNVYMDLTSNEQKSLSDKIVPGKIVSFNNEEFIFTSSSVYSSWDEKRRKEFALIHVKCLEENNRRVTIVNPIELITLADQELSRKSDSITDEGKSYEESSNNKVESHAEDEDDDESFDDPTDEENEAADGDDEARDIRSENEESQ